MENIVSVKGILEQGALSVPALIVACGMFVSLPVLLGERLSIQLRRRKFAGIITREDKDEDKLNPPVSLTIYSKVSLETKTLLSDSLIIAAFLAGALFSALVADGTPWETEADGSLIHVLLLLFFLLSIFACTSPPREKRPEKTRTLPSGPPAPKVGSTARKVWLIMFYAAIVFAVISPWWTPLYLGAAFQGVIVLRRIFSGGKNTPGGFRPVRKEENQENELSES